MQLDPTILSTAGIFATLVLLSVTTVFLFAQLKQDNSVMDIFYGPIFALSYWGTWHLTGQPDGVPTLIGGLLTLWSVRLGLRIARKNWGKPEDPRYATWRAAWRANGTLYVIVRSYLQVNLLQGLIIILVASPLWWLLAVEIVIWPVVFYSGVALMLFGLLYEAAADWQLDRFLARKRAGTESETLMTAGLFRYSRRPNYFGEATIWWGFAFAALSSGLAAGLTFVSPFVITYILTRVTGPILEDYFLEHYPDAYRAYMAKTPNFLIPTVY